MDNGRRMLEKDMEHIIIQMEIDIKEIGVTIFKVELVHIIIQTAIFIRENGLMANLMGKEIIFTMEIKVSTKEIGKMEKNKDLDN